MQRRDALKRLAAALPLVTLEPWAIGRVAKAAEAAAGLESSSYLAERTIEIEIDPETEEAAVATSVAVSPNGQIVAAGADDHRVRLWNVADGSLTTQLREHRDWVRAIAFHPSGKKLASASDDRTVLIWDLDSGTVLHRFDISTGIVHNVAFRPDGKWLASSGFDDVVRIYEVEAGKLVKELKCSASDVRALEFAPNNQRLAAAGRDGSVRVWDLSDYKVVADIPAHRMRIRSIAYSPDSQQFATAGDDRKLFLWNADGSRSAALPAPLGLVFTLKFVGRDHLAMGTSDNLIRVLDVQSRREIAKLAGHTGSVAALACHEDTGLLASAAFDTTVRLWKPQGTGRPAATVTQLPTLAPPRTSITK
ncbi:MAG: WD40 repeat domain-containing protein [Planctomycetales bacterium]|nr:WD40 repeat domain-containing protein [Planctomycetales bacterium]MBN8625917.1 WD40 repeat domain-containing protein [Planctomycetota bacterium]